MMEKRNRRKWVTTATMLVAILCVCVCFASAAQAATRYVAPEARGTGDGVSKENAASFRDMEFWKNANAGLQKEPVEVVFLNGQYLVSSDKERNMPHLMLTGIGDEKNALTLRGEKAGDVVFTRHPDDPGYTRENNKGPGFLFLRDSRNVIVRDLTFTAPGKPVGYATNFRGRDLLIENCHWHDLEGVYYGATGASYGTTVNVTFRNCRFERVGSGGHAHMAYNAYDPQHIRFVDCYFEDCAGDYVRFRDNTEYGVVTGCTFRSTGKFTNKNMPFIAMPLFNDDDSTKHPKKFNYEYFGTRFLIFNNKFIYETEDKPVTRIAICFHHSGYDPPDRRHLLDADEAKVLKSGTVAEKKALLQKNLGIDTSTVHVFGNEYTNVAHKGVYRFRATYGAKSRGGDGLYDIFETFNTKPVVKNAEEALRFFKR